MEKRFFVCFVTGGIVSGYMDLLEIKNEKEERKMSEKLRKYIELHFY